MASSSTVFSFSTAYAKYGSYAAGDRERERSTGERWRAESWKVMQGHTGLMGMGSMTERWARGVEGVNRVVMFHAPQGVKANLTPRGEREGEEIQ